MLADPARPGAPAPGEPAAAPARSRVAPAHVLTLPSISPDIPGRIEVVEGGEGLAPFATALAAEGLLTHRDLDLDTRGHLLPICTAAFARWVRRETRHVKFQVSATYTDDWETHMSDLAHSGFNHRKGDAEMKRLQSIGGALVLGLRNDCADWALIGPRCTALEQAHPGLGASVLHILEQALDATIGGFGPGRALGVAQCFHWQGESDERFRMEEIEYEECDLALTDFALDEGHGPVTLVMEWSYDEKEFLKESVTWDIPPEVTLVQVRAFDFGAVNMLTLAEFHAGIPEWACHGRRRPLAAATLLRLARALKPALAKTVRAAATLASIRAQHPVGGDHDGFYAISESLYPIILGWGAPGDGQDMVARMYDDMGQSAMESGEATSVRAIWIFDSGSVKSARRAISGLRNCFAVLRAIHTLLQLLATRIHR